MDIQKVKIGQTGLVSYGAMFPDIYGVVISNEKGVIEVALENGEVAQFTKVRHHTEAPNGSSIGVFIVINVPVTVVHAAHPTVQ